MFSLISFKILVVYHVEGFQKYNVMTLI